MKKILFATGVVALVGFGIIVLSNYRHKSNNTSDKITIVTTLFPQYDFAKTIGGNKAQVTLLLPPGIEAHAYEPKPSDITKINNAKVFVYTGEFMEPWAHDIVKSTSNKVKVVDASFGIKMMKKEGIEHEEEHDELTGTNDHESEEDHHHGNIDPHIWLDFDNATIMAGNIAKALIEVDPQNADYYQNNYKTYELQLNELNKTYKDTLSTCKSKTIIYGGHYAFGYMANKYGLEYVSAQGFSPDAEPTAKDMIALIEQIKNDSISYIFYEELGSPKIADTLANETSTKLLLLNGAHNLAKADYEAGVSFVSIMKNNLKSLSVGLSCQN